MVGSPAIERDGRDRSADVIGRTGAAQTEARSAQEDDVSAPTPPALADYQPAFSRPDEPFLSYVSFGPDKEPGRSR